MNCDRLAPWYRPLERVAFGRALERRRLALLPWALGGTPPSSPPVNALLLGEGDGRFVAALTARLHQGDRVECVDASAGMLALARERVEGSPDRSVDTRFHHADARAWLDARRAGIVANAERPFDLIVTNFFLDCFPAAELPALVAGIAAVAAPRARWLVAEFRQPPGRGPRATHAWAWLGMMYAFFRLATGLTNGRLADHRPLLAAHGLRLERAIVTRAGLLVSEGWRRRGDGV